MTKKSEDKEQFSDEEAQRRFEQALKGGLKTPPKPLKEKAASAKSGKPRK
jgi:hypothetical protein